MMARRSIWILSALLLGGAPALAAQRDRVARYDATRTATRWRQDVDRDTWTRHAVHYGKWLAAGAVAAFTTLAAREHQKSSREWDALLEICRSADDACALAEDGRYLRADAEALYQRSREYDGRANRRLLGAQASLLVTAALFILDLRPGDGPDNIPYAPIEVTARPAPDGALLGVRIAF
ncbi:MAG: hypothetical protein ACREME_01670 [Gemmatimonadales bacterium]